MVGLAQKFARELDAFTANLQQNLLDLPQIYTSFTRNLPKIYPKIYFRFTANLQQNLLSLP